MAILLIVAIGLRLYGMDWDNWLGLHPDERMIVMVAEKIRFFTNMNPDFFNYGSLPIYLLRFFKPDGGYIELIKTGRYLSVFFDALTVLFVYKISKYIFKRDAVALASAFFYSIAFFPIQNSHFYVVDVLLTTTATILMYRLLMYLKKPTLMNVIIIATLCGAMIATKFTAVIFIVLTGAVIVWKNLNNRSLMFFHLMNFGVIFAASFFFFMPYAFIENQRYFSDIGAQLKMNSNPYIFPYTLQYIGTLPYFYYLKNIFLWGLGPLISIPALVGFLNLKKYLKNHSHVLLMVFLVFYFAIVGRSAVKFMRYMLPLYPLLAVLAGYGLFRIKEISKYLALVVVALAVIWTIAYVNIYSYDHTRLAASDWINKNITPGSTLAVEHWDDRLPVSESSQYYFEELTLYDQPDDDYKWDAINTKLSNSDYIIIASNRLHVPLSRLIDCSKYKVCYPKTAEYYEKLFSGKLGFRQVAEFQANPGIKIGKYYFGINDQSADESFTVYDHPKILIFKKN